MDHQSGLNRPCKGCGAPLIFATSADGKIIPLDEKSRLHIYELSDSSDELMAVNLGSQEVYLNHAVCCPKFGRTP